MKKAPISILVALVLMLIWAVPALGITNGHPDGDGHPYVGLVVFYDEEWKPLWRCSGTLLAPTVFLTAGHCASGANYAQVWFTPGRPAGYPLTNGTTGIPYAHPNFNDFADFPQIWDVGVVILDQPVVMDTYGRLPTTGFLDQLATRRGTQDVSFTVVGYGLQEQKPTLVSLVERWVGEAHLVNLRNSLTDGYNLMTSNNGGHWSGGTCSGDSGGPILYSNTNIVVGINSFGVAPWCKGNDYSYRTDTSYTRDFLGQFIALP